MAFPTSVQSSNQRDLSALICRAEGGYARPDLAAGRARAGRIDGPLLLNTKGGDWTATPPPGARTTLDRHPNYILAAYLASGT
jgi:hypothetical protein